MVTRSSLSDINLPAYDTVRQGGFIQPANSFMPDVAPNHFLVSTAVPVYYVHNDAYGPFNRVVFLADGGITEYESLICRDDGEEPADGGDPNEEVNADFCPPSPIVRLGGSNSAPMYLQNVIVPVPPMVHGGTTDRLRWILRMFDQLILPGIEVDFGEVKVPVAISAC